MSTRIRIQKGVPCLLEFELSSTSNTDDVLRNRKSGRYCVMLYEVYGGMGILVYSDYVVRVTL